MNCTVIQRRLLSAEQPDQPSAEIESHLAQCSVCRAWQRRLVRMERQVPLLPVPPSTAKADLLRRLLGTRAGEAAGRPALWQSSLAPGPKERGLRKVSVAFALAAALLVFALAWWAWPHNTSPSPAAGQLTQRQLDQKRLDQRLSKVLLVEAPKERVLQLADLAEKVHGEASAMMDNAAKLDQWARFYARIVSQHLMEQARQLPPADQPAVLRMVATSLTRTESDASKLAIQLQADAPGSAASFDRIAVAARKGRDDLRL